MKIILIGFMGSGKTSVAIRLGQLLNLPIIEMDQLVMQKTASKTMDEVFAKGGELLLRETEMLVAQEYGLVDHSIISTGGGVVLNETILDLLKKPYGKIIFLNAAFKTITKRLRQDTSRPLFKNRVEAEALYHLRLPLYLKYADQVVDVDDKSIEEVADNILRVYGQ